MQQVDGLERAHHHLEMRDPAIIPESDDVDAIDPDAIDLVFELEHRAGVAAPKPGPPSTLSAPSRYLKVISRPRCGVCTTGLSNTASGSRRSHSAARSWDLV